MNKKLFKDTKNIIILVLVLLILGELVWATRFLSRPLPIPWKKLAPKPAPTPYASLVLSPAKGSFKKGESFTVEVKLETEKEVVTNGIDIILSFDKEKLAVQGEEIKSGNLHPWVMINAVDNKKGKIEFSALNPPEKAEIKGGGTMATVTFKALGDGSARVEFDFIPGSTTDTNVAQAGRGDILTRVVDGEYLIE